MRDDTDNDDTDEHTADVATDEPIEGGGIINLSWVGTAVFVVTALVATIAPDPFSGTAAVASLVLFAIGCAVFLWAYALAVARSRTDLIGIGGLYFLQGTAPKVVRFRLRLALAIQIVVAIASSAIRPYTSLAFGILVPVFGLGLCGLWGARFGTFFPRPADEGRRGRRTVEPAATDDEDEDASDGPDDELASG